MPSEQIAVAEVESRDDSRRAPGRVLFNDGWGFRNKVTAFQELGGSVASGWNNVHLPHDALIAQPRRADFPRGEMNGYFAGGVFEYRKTYRASTEDSGRRILLEFDGVYRDAAIYVNGSLAGQRAFGYSRFAVRIDPFLVFDAENEIRVECRTHLDSRWYAGAGIYRDVHLVVKDAGHIVRDAVRVTSPTVEHDAAVVEVIADIENAGPLTKTYRVDVLILDPEGAIVGTGSSPVTLLPGTRATARQRLFLDNPALWSVDAPNLHDVLLTLRDGERVVDEESTVVGIRSLQLDPRHGLRINGEIVKLRGACIHLDNGPLGAVSMRAAEERKVARLKDAGFNAIRSSHCPMSTALLDACDRLGMLVMDETFDVWTSGKSDYDYSFDFPEWWERDVEALVAKDFNHPSVIFYSIGNEIPETGTPIGSTWGRRLAEKVRSLDPTRFVTNGINPFVAMLDTIVPQMKARRDAAADTTAGGGGVNTMMAGFGQMMGHIQASDAATERTEESFAVLDVAGMNYSDARYVADRERFPDRIIVGTETWPNSIANNWALVEADPRVIGDFTWTGWDYLGETGIGAIRYADAMVEGSGFSGGFPELTAWCGDIDIIGDRRPVSFFRETVFGLRSVPYIAVQRPENHGRPIGVATPWAWSDSICSWSWPGSEGRPAVVEVYSDADEIELQLNGARLALVPVQDYRVEFDTIYQPGTLVAIAYTAGVETGRATVETDLARELSIDVEGNPVLSDGTDLAYLPITLTGGGGDQPVKLTITGPAVLQAFGSGAPVTTESFDSAIHTTFDGRALAILRPTGFGEITVTAETDGCTPATITLTAQ
ncbi:glycoside hydrolase family 2 TIM barrel-domain containing protein [Microbacterium rhizomatis]|uniref:glycoside hydrolase family 2 TIM barrel-domain containing protein n=1 Tax=Microbacterium rhizomatis TaxID=1631477 RepID=UPI001FE4F2A4|nr:glycoside hydrolase family 2 TIM barrel-domain containing protein [Microbacterium rhizomatis]